MAPEVFAKRALRAVLGGDAIIVVPAWPGLVRTTLARH